MKMITNIWIWILLMGCTSLQEGHNGISATEEESRQRGVFIKKYLPMQNPVVINDTLSLRIKSAWLEKQWKHTANPDRVLELDEYQLIVEVEEQLKGYANYWTIGVDGDRYFRKCSKTCLISDFNKMPTLKKETWLVQAGWHLDSSSRKTEIGTFVLLTN